MPNVRIQNTVANARTGFSTPNSRVFADSAIHARVGYNTPNARASNFQTGILTPGATTVFLAGSPIGLLLALTYANTVTTVAAPVYQGDLRPNVRIC